MPKLEATSIQSLYIEHHNWLLGWLRRRLGNIDHAADIAQDTFVRVLLKSAIEVIEEPRAYLTVIAKGLVANAHRRDALERTYLETLALVPEALAPSQEYRAMLLETLFEIDAMLDRLPAKARSTFLLSQLEGLTYAEIAERLDISVRTVKRHMVLGFEQCLMFSLP
ncbi:RNA polymerase sigma-70 factor (ECF subfamily) [Collimonas sp. PA-H2]|uniref:sigma-70 family RNA polymerase sigma factor n=1 Tax=Collimonas sp. PA-H2 TaxID=1881062 RepID=UPI000BF89F91|nr:sigma-70 family RNA polymerase sigma factor [Collimonas sp. PA-H2]PFH11753.1 RNA polymerase sigma-70 factor (ECF subfamily) [Collimonas sp. PA-H2]